MKLCSDNSSKRDELVNDRAKQQFLLCFDLCEEYLNSDPNAPKVKTVNLQRDCLLTAVALSTYADTQILLAPDSKFSRFLTLHGFLDPLKADKHYFRLSRKALAHGDTHSARDYAGRISDKRERNGLLKEVEEAAAARLAGEHKDSGRNEGERGSCVS